MEKERDFYFSKLRDIEILCQRHELEHLPVGKHLSSLLFGMLLVLMKTFSVWWHSNFHFLLQPSLKNYFKLIGNLHRFSFHKLFMSALSVISFFETLIFISLLSLKILLMKQYRTKAQLHTSVSLNLSVLLTTYSY